MKKIYEMKKKKRNMNNENEESNVWRRKVIIMKREMIFNMKNDMYCMKMKPTVIKWNIQYEMAVKKRAYVANENEEWIWRRNNDIDNVNEEYILNMKLIWRRKYEEKWIWYSIIFRGQWREYTNNVSNEDNNVISRRIMISCMYM